MEGDGKCILYRMAREAPLLMWHWSRQQKEEGKHQKEEISTEREKQKQKRDEYSWSLVWKTDFK